MRRTVYRFSVGHADLREFSIRQEERQRYNGQKPWPDVFDVQPTLESEIHLARMCLQAMIEGRRKRLLR